MTTVALLLFFVQRRSGVAVCWHLAVAAGVRVKNDCPPFFAPTVGVLDPSSVTCRGANKRRLPEQASMGARTQSHLVNH